MKKKITADLTSLAHRILQFKKKEDINELLKLSRELHERLTVLAYVQEHFADLGPTAGLAQIEQRLEEIAGTDPENFEQGAQNAFRNNNLSDLYISSDEDDREDMELPGISTIHKMVEEMPDDSSDESLEVVSPENETNISDRFFKNDIENIAEDFQTMPLFERKNEQTDIENSTENEDDVASVDDSITADKSNSLGLKSDEIDSYTFDVDTFTRKEVQQSEIEENNSNKDVPAPEQRVMDFDEVERVTNGEKKPKSLNQQLRQGIQIGMNDRIGFIKHLFDGNDVEYNRVVSQLSTIEKLDEARHFIESLVKPDYNNWEGKETYETRFLEILERSY